MRIGNWIIDFGFNYGTKPIKLETVKYEPSLCESRLMRTDLPYGNHDIQEDDKEVSK